MQMCQRQKGDHIKWKKLEIKKKSKNLKMEKF